MQDASPYGQADCISTTHKYVNYSFLSRVLRFQPRCLLAPDYILVSFLSLGLRPTRESSYYRGTTALLILCVTKHFACLDTYRILIFFSGGIEPSSGRLESSCSTPELTEIDKERSQKRSLVLATILPFEQLQVTTPSYFQPQRLLISVGQHLPFLLGCKAKCCLAHSIQRYTRLDYTRSQTLHVFGHVFKKQIIPLTS